MLSFNKEMNNTTNVDTSKYARFGRTTPEEIVFKKFQDQMKNIKKPESKPLEQKSLQRKNMPNIMFRNKNKMK